MSDIGNTYILYYILLPRWQRLEWGSSLETITLVTRVVNPFGVREKHANPRQDGREAWAGGRNGSADFAAAADKSII